MIQQLVEDEILVLVPNSEKTSTSEPSAAQLNCKLVWGNNTPIHTPGKDFSDLELAEIDRKANTILQIGSERRPIRYAEAQLWARGYLITAEHAKLPRGQRRRGQTSSSDFETLVWNDVAPGHSRGDAYTEQDAALVRYFKYRIPIGNSQNTAEADSSPSPGGDDSCKTTQKKAVLLNPAATACISKTETVLQVFLASSDRKRPKLLTLADTKHNTKELKINYEKLKAREKATSRDAREVSSTEDEIIGNHWDRKTDFRYQLLNYVKTKFQDQDPNFIQTFWTLAEYFQESPNNWIPSLEKFQSKHFDSLKELVEALYKKASGIATPQILRDASQANRALLEKLLEKSTLETGDFPKDLTLKFTKQNIDQGGYKNVDKCLVLNKDGILSETVIATDLPWKKEQTLVFNKKTKKKEILKKTRALTPSEIIARSKSGGIASEAKFFELARERAKSLKVSTDFFIPKFRGSGTNAEMVMPFADGQNLYKWLRRYSYRSDNPRVIRLRRKAANDFLDQLKSLHSLGFAHRDVKPENILIHAGTRLVTSKEAPHAILTDFGLHADLSIADASGDAGTPGYIPPEVFGTTILLESIVLKEVGKKGRLSASKLERERIRKDIFIPMIQKRDTFASAVVLSETFFGNKLQKTIHDLGNECKRKHGLRGEKVNKCYVSAFSKFFDQIKNTAADSSLSSSPDSPFHFPPEDTSQPFQKLIELILEGLNPDVNKRPTLTEFSTKYKQLMEGYPLQFSSQLSDSLAPPSLSKQIEVHF